MNYISLLIISYYSHMKYDLIFPNCETDLQLQTIQGKGHEEKEWLLKYSQPTLKIR